LVCVPLTAQDDDLLAHYRGQLVAVRTADLRQGFTGHDVLPEGDC
jgi:hypothetical protein